jgi:hypothetical protein
VLYEVFGFPLLETIDEMGGTPWAFAVNGTKLKAIDNAAIGPRQRNTPDTLLVGSLKSDTILKYLPNTTREQSEKGQFELAPVIVGAEQTLKSELSLAEKPTCGSRFIPSTRYARRNIARKRRRCAHVKEFWSARVQREEDVNAICFCLHNVKGFLIKGLQSTRRLQF